MMKIVISYRRADSDAMAGRINDRLVNEFGSQSVFMDIDSIPIGVNFRTYIADALKNMDIMLLIIGPNWLGKSRAGTTRIQNSTDPCRVEVETALQLKIPIWPVLVNDAVMPPVDQLPPSLRDLPDFNAAIVGAGRDFHIHMDRLIREMNTALNRSAPATGFAPAAISSAGEPALKDSAAAERKTAGSAPDASSHAEEKRFFKRAALFAGFVFGGLGMIAFVWLFFAGNPAPDRRAVTPEGRSTAGASLPARMDAAPAVKSAAGPVGSELPAGKLEPVPAKADSVSAKLAPAVASQGPKKIMLANLGGVPVSLPTPGSFCDLMESEPSDKRMIGTLTDLLAKSGNKLLGMFADCEQLLDWRDGKRLLLDDYAQYQVPLKQSPGSLEEICSVMRKQGDALMSEQLPDIKARVERAITNVKMNQTNFIGVLDEDANACYAGMMQKIHTEVNTDKTQVTVFAITFIKERVLFLYRFTVYRRWDTFNETLTSLKRDVAALIAANR